MPVTVDLATSRFFKVLVLTEKTLQAVNRFKHLPALAEKIQALRTERADRIRIKEKIRAIRNMKLIKKLEPPVIVEKLRDYERMESLVGIGGLYFKLAEAYKARSTPENMIGIRLERHVQNSFLAKAVQNIMEASQEAERVVDGVRNLYLEIQYKRDVLRMLNSKDVLTVKLYSLKAELEKELPVLQKKFDQEIADRAVQPIHGN